jgi:hypothetical protein
MVDYSFQPSQGPGSSNYQMPQSPSYFGGQGSGGQNYLMNYGGPQTGMNPTAPATDWAGRFQNISEGVGAFQSLASIYGMFQQLGMAKKAFKFEREGTKRNFNASATAYNSQVARRHRINENYESNRGNDYESLESYSAGKTVPEWT